MKSANQELLQAAMSNSAQSTQQKLLNATPGAAMASTLSQAQVRNILTYLYDVDSYFFADSMGWRLQIGENAGQRPNRYWENKKQEKPIVFHRPCQNGHALHYGQKSGSENCE